MNMQANNQILWNLHQQLQSMPDGDTVDSFFEDETSESQLSEVQTSKTHVSLRQQIRALLPMVDTGSIHPHKKTPQGCTDILHMNYTRNRAGEIAEGEIEHLRFFAQTAQAIGIHLEILVHIPHRQDIESILITQDYAGLDYSIIDSSQPISKWAEDSVEYLDNGYAAVLTPLHDDLLEWAMKEGRRQRWHPHVSPEQLEEVLNNDHLWIPLGIRVNSSETGQERERVARSRGQHVGHIRTYIEGGNMIAGEDADGRYVVLVGKDAIATTACFYQLTHEEVCQVIAEDFALDADQVIAVEQPGQFHLDMGLLFIGEGKVILNDSQVALENAKEMAELAPCTTTEVMAEKMQLQCVLETVAAQDLETAGLTVIRKSLENSGMYNFFNGEFVMGRDRHTYYLTNGGPLDQQDTFAELMVKEWQVVKQVFFSPSKAAYKSLKDRGGVGCRLKGSSLCITTPKAPV